MDTFSSTIVALSVVAGAIITIFTLFSLIVRGVAWFASLPKEVRNYLYKPRYILVPTSDEISLYSIKEPCSAVRMTDMERVEEISGKCKDVLNEWREEAGRRISLIKWFLMMISVAFVARLYHYAIVDDVTVSTAPYLLLMLLGISACLLVATALRGFGPVRRANLVRSFWY